MSVVVAIKQEGRVYLGADSQVTKGGTRRTLKNPNNYKIWKVKGANNCLMAHVGNVRDANVVRIMNDAVDQLAQCQDCVDFEFVVGDLVPHIIHQLHSFGYVAKEEGKEFSGMNSEFLFAYEDKLFHINGDGCVIEVDDCIAIGSGAPEAIGSVLSTAEEEDPRARIVKAIKASAANDIYVDYPIVLADTETTDFDVIYESGREKDKEEESQDDRRKTHEIREGR